MTLSTSPHAWLSVYYATLRADPAFLRLAPSLQAAALADRVAAESPSRATEIRQWNTATLNAMLAVLQAETDARPLRRTTTLWRATKGSRTVECTAVYMPTGIDLRVIEDRTPWQTLLFRRSHGAEAQAGRWQQEMAVRGWSIQELGDVR